MTTIREIVEAHDSNASINEDNALIASLEEREQAKVQALGQVALQHGIQAPVLAKVLLDLGLGGPHDETTTEFINAQFEAFKAQLIAAYSEATGIPPELLNFPDTTPPESTEEGLS